MNPHANTRGRVARAPRPAATFITLARWLVAALLAVALVAPATLVTAQTTPAAAPAPAPAPPASAPPASAPPAVASPVGVPASRAASKVVVITIHGEIDRWTARSVARRIKLAQTAGADAIVFDIDTPGGEALAMLAIARDIKTSSVKNTVAWVNRSAYSAGTVIALACREIVVASGSVLGDALPIEINILSGFKPIPDAEREKFLGPIMADLVESARRNGHDEVLVQGFVRRGVELWLIEHTQTGERLFVTQEQYSVAVGDEPDRGVPSAPSITGEPDTSKSGPVGPSRSTGTSTLPGPAGPSGSGGGSESGSSKTDFIPASPNITPQLKDEVDRALDVKGSASSRPDLRSAAHAGLYRPIEYVASGAGVLTFTTDTLLRYRIAVAKVDSDTQMQQFFGATGLTRLDETWSEHLARFLSQFWVRGLLIAIFLIALFIEMTSPGVVLPGAIALAALVALFAPLVLVDMSAWWMVAAILLGLALVLLELFVLTGTIVAGALGVLLIFGGLVGVAAGGPANLFPGSSGGSGGDANIGLLTALVAIVGAIGVMWLIGRNMGSLPFLGRLVLTDAHGQSPEDGTIAATLAGSSANRTGGAGGAVGAGSDGLVGVGAMGVAITPLRPSGRVQIGEQVVDAVAQLGFISAGAKIRVVEASAFRVVVEHASDGEPG